MVLQRPVQDTIATTNSGLGQSIGYGTGVNAEGMAAALREAWTGAATAGGHAQQMADRPGAGRRRVDGRACGFRHCDWPGDSALDCASAGGGYSTPHSRGHVIEALAARGQGCRDTNSLPVAGGMYLVAL